MHALRNFSSEFSEGKVGAAYRHLNWRLGHESPLPVGIRLFAMYYIISRLGAISVLSNGLSSWESSWYVRVATSKLL